MAAELDYGNLGPCFFEKFVHVLYSLDCGSEVVCSLGCLCWNSAGNHHLIQHFWEYLGRASLPLTELHLDLQTHEHSSEKEIYQCKACERHWMLLLLSLCQSSPPIGQNMYSRDD